MGRHLGAAEAYQQLRPLLFGLAYRMLGEVSAAEDIVQEAFLRYHRAESQGTVIGSPKAFLSAMATRLCIDQLRSARARRETYVGEWLPEPLLTGPAGDPAATAAMADSLSMAFLLLLERLTPVERAVFLLHDVFGYGYPEIADIIGKTEANCRQLALRARRHVHEHRPRFEASRTAREELASRFFRAVTDGDLDGLVSMLAADVTAYGDGGGVAPSWPRPISGRDRVGRLLTGIGRLLGELPLTVTPAEVNGQPGALVREPGGALVNVFVLDIAGGQVQAVRSVISRPKLRHLAPLADLPSLRRRLPRAR